MRALRQYVIGLAAAGMIALGSWGLQARVLPSPTSPEHFAARTTFWLQKHRLVLDSFRTGRSTIRGACLRGWFSSDGGRRLRGSLFVQRSTVLLVAGFQDITLVIGRRSQASRAWMEAMLGCSRELQDLLVEALRRGVHLGAERSHVAGQPVVGLRLPRLGIQLMLDFAGRARRLHFPGLGGARLTLYVDDRTAKPLVAVAIVGGRRILARLSLVSATPTILARIGLGGLAERLGGR